MLHHYILPMTGVDLQSLQGLKTLLAFAKRNSLMKEKLEVVITLLIQSEEKAAAEIF